MITFTIEDIARSAGAPTATLKMQCMMCLSFPTVELDLETPGVWRQTPNPVPSNRLCFHLRHELDCPSCEVGVATSSEVRETFFIEPAYRDEVFERDRYTCQACGYAQTSKPATVGRRRKAESEQDYLYRRFVATLARSDQPRSLVVAHYNKRYGRESYAKRHRLANARALCSECHNAETAKHQWERWALLFSTCPWLSKLE